MLIADSELAECLLSYFQEQLSISQDIQEIYGESEAFKSLGITYLAKGDLKRAEKNLRSAIRVQESIRKKLGSKDLLKVSLFDTQIDTYNQLQKVLVKQNKIKDALEIAERGRARAFVELLFDQKRRSQASPFKGMKKIKFNISSL